MSTEAPVALPADGADTENDLRAAHAQVHLPRIAIKYCTQCKWLLRAAYFAQELLSTFSNTLGEVSLVPTTGGVFTISILVTSPADFTSRESVLWDRKTQGGFPDVKQLKTLVRDLVDPSRSLGHIDRANAKPTGEMDQGDDAKENVADLDA